MNGKEIKRPGCEQHLRCFSISQNIDGAPWISVQAVGSSATEHNTCCSTRTVTEHAWWGVLKADHHAEGIPSEGQMQKPGLICAFLNFFYARPPRMEISCLLGRSALV